MPDALGSGFGSDSASEEPFSLFSSATQMPTHRTSSNPMQIPGVKSNVVPALVRPQVMLSSGSKCPCDQEDREVAMMLHYQGKQECDYVDYSNDSG